MKSTNNHKGFNIYMFKSLIKEHLFQYQGEGGGGGETAVAIT